MFALRSSLARRSSAAAKQLQHRASYTTYSQLPEEHRMVYEMCRTFADQKLAPHAGEWDKNHAFPKQAVTKLVRAVAYHVCRKCVGSDLDNACRWHFYIQTLHVNILVFITELNLTKLSHIAYITGRAWHDGNQHFE
jgi:hypothetical protein